MNFNVKFPTLMTFSAMLCKVGAFFYTPGKAMHKITKIAGVIELLGY